MTGSRLLCAGLTGLLLLSACSDDVADAGSADPSKLSAELEARARDIEEKADMAVVASEREAGAELESLRQEAGNAEAEAAGAGEMADQ